MAKFDALLNQIHQSTQTGALAVDEDTYIKIDKNRQFVVPDSFNPIIAYEGDVNSQVITFACPAVVEGHQLADCANKKLRWSNMASGNEGSSVLSYRLDKDILYLSWEAPPETFTMAGDLEISITFSDYLNGRIVYSWNTAPLLGLKVGKTLDKVSDKISEENLVNYSPAKNEVLIVNTETRQITEPKGYNYIICNYGDVGTSVVYFQIKRYVRGIDLLDENTNFTVYWKLESESAVDRGGESIEQSHKYLYAVEIDDRDSEGLVNVIWLPSPNITSNVLQYHGPITIMLEFSNKEKVWRTCSYDKLEIGEYGFSAPVSDLPGEDTTRLNYIINADEITTDKDTLTVSGLTTHRQVSNLEPRLLNRHELVVDYKDGQYYGTKMGLYKNQDSREAPYIAYSPEVIIIVNGGDAFDK